MFRAAYMGRERILQMLSLSCATALALVSEEQKRWKGLRPVFLGPRTLKRTWGTRPVNKSCATTRATTSDRPYSHREDAHQFPHSARSTGQTAKPNPKAG